MYFDKSAMSIYSCGCVVLSDVYECRSVPGEKGRACGYRIYAEKKIEKRFIEFVPKVQLSKTFANRSYSGWCCFVICNTSLYLLVTENHNPCSLSTLV